MTLLKLALKGIKAHPTRLFLTALAVVAGVAFVVGSFIISDSLKQVFGQLVEDANSGIDARVQATDLDFGDEAVVPDTLIAQLEALPEVDEAVGFVAPADEDSFNPFVALDENDEEVTPNGPPVLSFSWVDGDGADEGGFALADGRGPEGPGEVALLDAYAEALDASVGDTIRMKTLDDGIQEFELVGTVEFPASGGAWFVLFEFETAQQLFGREGEVSEISLSTASGVSTEDLLAAVGDELPEGLEVIDAVAAQEEDSAEFESIIDIFRNVLLAFAVIALFVSLFIIYNTFKILVNQRVREFGVLRAIGATSAQLIWSVVIEAVALGLLASVVGIVAGVGVSQLITGALRATGGFPDTDIVITAQTIGIGFAVGVGATVIASLVPAVSARRISPVEAMRNAGIEHGSRTPRLIGGGIAAVVGLGLVAWGLFGGGGVTPVLTRLGIGAVLTFIGTALLSELFGGPIVSVIGSRLGRKVTSVALVVGGIGLLVLGFQAVADGSILGAGTALLGILGAASGIFLATNAFSDSQLAGDLARQNAVRNPDRTASTATALMIGLALVTTVSVMGESLKATFVETLDTSIDADLFVSNQTGLLPSGLADEIAELDDAALVSEVGGVPVQLVDGEDVLNVTIYDTEQREQVVRFGLADDAADISDGGMWVLESELEDRGWEIGDEIELRFENLETDTLEIAGSYDDSTVIGAPLLVDWNQIQPFDDDPEIFFVGVIAREGVDIADLQDQVLEITADENNIDVLDNAEIRDQAEGQIDGLLTIVNAMLGFALAVALLGIINTIALSVAERTREIGLLRAVGMTRTQLSRSVRWEAVMVAVFGALLGIALGVLFAYAAVQALPEGFIDSIAVPWVTLGTIVMLAAILGVVAAVIPGWSAGRKNILEAIATE